EGAGCDQLLVADAGNQFGAVDGTGGIERVDLSRKMSSGLVVKDTDLGGHPSTISVASAHVAFSIITFNGGLAQKVVALDPMMARLTGDASPPAAYMPFARVSPDRRELYVGVASGSTAMAQLAPGVY